MPIPRLSTSVRAFIGSALFAVLTELLKRVLEGFPRGLAVVLLCLALAVAALSAIAHLWTCRRRSAIHGATGDAVEVPCYRTFVRIAGTTVALLVAAALLYGQGGEALRWLHAWAVLGRWQPPEFALKAAPKIVNVGDVLTLDVLLNGGPAGAGEWCEWAPSIGPRRGGCSIRHFIPLDFVSIQEARKQVVVAVTVFDSRGWRLGAPEPITVLVRYTPVVELRTSQRRIFAGQDASIQVLLNGKPPGSGYTCEWTIGRRFLGRRACALAYTGEADLGVAQRVTSVRIAVTVLGAKGTEAGQTEAVIEVVRPRNHFVFVLDASERTRRVAGLKSLLDLMKHDLIVDLELINSQGANVGIEVFGGGPLVPSRSGCDNSDTLVPIQELKLAWMRERVAALAPGGLEAPLLLALKRGLTALAPYRTEADDRLHLVTITARNVSIEMRHPLREFTVPPRRSAESCSAC